MYSYIILYAVNLNDDGAGIAALLAARAVSPGWPAKPAATSGYIRLRFIGTDKIPDWLGCVEPEQIGWIPSSRRTARKPHGTRRKVWCICDA